jgi:hypothetical protein
VSAPVRLAASAFVLLSVVAVPALRAQASLQPVAFRAEGVSAAPVSTESSSSESEASPAPAAGAAGGAAAQSSGTGHVLLHAIGAEVHVGLNGVGMDFALPVARKWNVRVGGQYLQYTGHFTEEGAQIDADLHVGGGKAGIDWFPFNNGFHVSPQVFFAIQTQVHATVLVPSGTEVTLNGNDYISSPSDPLHGQATVTTRKTAPGLAIGWGNISPRGGAHWSFPVEVGFYYIGQPDLNVTFDGSACARDLSGCQKVTTDPDFQRDLKRFIDRNNHNLSYASFFPVAQVGVGYRF